MRGRPDFRMLIMDLGLADEPFARAQCCPDRGRAAALRRRIRNVSLSRGAVRRADHRQTRQGDLSKNHVSIMV